MDRNPTHGCSPPPGARFAKVVAWAGRWLAALLLATVSGWALPAQAPELSHFEMTRSDEGLMLDAAVRFELPHSVEDAEGLLADGVAARLPGDRGRSAIRA